MLIVRSLHRVLFSATDSEENRRKEPDSQKVSCIKGALQNALSGQAKSIKERKLYIVGELMPNGLELKESASKPFLFGSAIASLEQIYLSLSEETPDMSLEHYQEMAAIITKRFIKKKEKEGLICSLIKKIASLFFTLSKQDQVESLNNKIQYYRKEPLSMFPFLPEEISLKVLQDQPLTALLTQIATINSQGRRLAGEVLFSRAKALGYEGGKDFIEIKGYFQDMHDAISQFYMSLPKRFQGASKTDLDSLEENLLALQNLSNSEIACLFDPKLSFSEGHFAHWATLAKYILLFSKEHPQIDPEIDELLRRLPIEYCLRDVVFLLSKRGASKEALQEIFKYCFKKRYQASYLQQLNRHPAPLLLNRRANLFDRDFFEKMLSACDQLDFTEEKWFNFLDTLKISNQLGLFNLLLEKKGALLRQGLNNQEVKNKALLHIFGKESDEMLAEFDLRQRFGMSPTNCLNDLHIEDQITWFRKALLLEDTEALKLAFSAQLDPNLLEIDDSSPFHTEFTTAWFLSQAPLREEKIRLLREHGWTGSET
jgi:hypothetical protein